MLHKENPRYTMFAKLYFISILFFFLFASSSQAITISGAETVTTNSNTTYSATGCSGSVAWSVTGTGASISSNGVLTAGSASCGAQTITASCSDGSNATQAVRVSNAGQWVAFCYGIKLYYENYPYCWSWPGGGGTISTIETINGDIRAITSTYHNIALDNDPQNVPICQCNAFPIRGYDGLPACNADHPCTGELAGGGTQYSYNTTTVWMAKYQCLPCTNGQTIPCYTGTGGTQGVGACKSGTQTCVNGQWGACSGQVIPTAEICDGKDNNCNGDIYDGAVCVRPSGDMGDPSCNAQNQ